MCTKNSENLNPQKPGEGQSGDLIMVVVLVMMVVLVVMLVLVVMVVVEKA